MITDTHCHLDVKPLFSNVEKILNEAREKGVKRFIIPAIEADNMKNIISLVEKHSDVFFSTGNHPNRLDHFNIKEIEKYISHEKCVAVGECGLDWYRLPKDANFEKGKQKQFDTFRQQIELSIKYKKPLILHSRDTDEDMVSVLEEYGSSLIGGVVHCYVGSNRLLDLLKYNFYFGIGGVVTYKSAVDLQKNIKRIPLDKIVIETDAPYLTPEPFRKETNKPVYTREVLSKIAELRGANLNYLEAKIEENTNKLFFNI